MFELQIHKDGAVVHRHSIGPQPSHIGRARTNDLVLASPRVSSQHLIVWTDADTVWFEDVGSRNGTTLNGDTLTGRKAATTGAVLVLGDAVELHLVGTAPAHDDALPSLFVEDTASGVQIAVRAQRAHFGSGIDADIRLQEGPARAATLIVHSHEVWLGTDEGERELVIGEPFDVCGRVYVLRADTGAATKTEALDEARYPYDLAVSLEGASGPSATLTHRRTRAVHVVRSEVRVTLLYVLARTLAAHVDEGAAAEVRGWIHDDDVASGLWGRERFKLEPNNLHVLVHRLRKEVEAAGFDPWFIEKKRRHLRLRLDGAVVE
ncbi:MAG: FHA domain-containing protein [Proteobacteria bacterium]|nr:FHA domain-containing protein [Pseudomonadota bacterium]